MYFITPFTIPANTLKSSPATQEINLILGTITKIEVAFPPGCARQVFSVVKSSLFQLSPANPDSYYNWDNFTFSHDSEYPLTDLPYTLTLVGWSPGTKFDHQIEWRFSVSPGKGTDIKSLLAHLGGL